jgi:hypothetical protein
LVVGIVHAIPAVATTQALEKPVASLLFMLAVNFLRIHTVKLDQVQWASAESALKAAFILAEAWEWWVAHWHTALRDIVYTNNFFGMKWICQCLNDVR